MTGPGNESNPRGLLNKSLMRMQQARETSAKDPQKNINLPAKANSGWAILKQEMVNRLPKKDVFNTVLISVAKAFMDTNTKEISEADRNYLVNELTDNIIKHYPSIRLNEIPEAIWKGVRGGFGEYYGLSLVSFEHFIERYLLSDQRTQLVKELPADDTAKPVPDLPTQFEMAKNVALLALQRKKDRKDVSTMAGSVYDFLDKLNLLNFSVNEKYDMMADAARELINELKFKLTLARSEDRPEIKKDLATYKAAITEHAAICDRLSTLVKMRAKKLALDAYLNNILLENSDLNEMIESRKQLFISTDKVKP
ncbi:MAG: hypothetical protein ACTHMI_24470 [Mucilaginibacter sp.]